MHAVNFVQLNITAMKENSERPARSGKDQSEKLVKENELLKLKLSAERGATFDESTDLDPAIENQFLKNVIEFEKQYAVAKPKPVYEIIGKPVYKKAEELTHDQLSSELKRIDEILTSHGIMMDFLAEYPDEVMYRFITEELFVHETDFISVPGMMTGFIYEEFHPNHEYDIRERAVEFIKGWFDRDFSEFSWELASEWTTDQGIILKKNEVLEKFKSIFKNFKSFQNTDYNILDIHPDVQDGKEEGLGHAEGMVKYDGLTQEGNRIHYEGPFKLYLKLEYNWWNIFFAHWPGLEW